MNKIISFKTKFGWISISETNNYIDSISFGRKSKKGSSNNLTNWQKDIKKYFLGNFHLPVFPMKVKGSPLQKKIWNEMKKIPYGKTISYGSIAKKLKTSPRYVGKVCGQNKHLLIIPCHRVICSDGKLGGFSGLGGIKFKKCLIDLESNYK